MEGMPYGATNDKEIRTDPLEFDFDQTMGVHEVQAYK